MVCFCLTIIGIYEVVLDGFVVAVGVVSVASTAAGGKHCSHDGVAV